MLRTVLLSLLLGLSVMPSISPSAHAQLPGDSTYTVEAGDTLYSISREVGISVPTLQDWNDLEGTALQIGQTLRLRPPHAAVPPDSVEPPPLGTWTVSQGDTFVGLALRLGTTADTLFALNDSTTAPLAPRRSLHLPPRFAPPTHVVRPGETLYGIAGQYGISLRRLQQANALDSTALRAGQRLTLPGRTGISSPNSPALPDTSGVVTRFPATFAGRLTASGEPYAPDAFVGSHPSLPFNSVVLLSRRETQAHTFVRIVDRGPIDEAFLMDVSEAVARALQLDGRNQPVDLRVVWVDDTAR